MSESGLEAGVPGLKGAHHRVEIFFTKGKILQRLKDFQTYAVHRRSGIQILPLPAVRGEFIGGRHKLFPKNTTAPLLSSRSAGRLDNGALRSENRTHGDTL